MRYHVTTAKDNDEPADLNLIRPVCYLTRPVNALLLGLLDLCKQYWRLLLPVVAVFYLGAMVAFSEDWFLVAIAPIGLGLVGILGHVGLSIVMLALFARHSGTRLTCVAILHLVIIGPFLILALDDTLLMLILGENTAFVLITLHTVVMTFVYPHYGHRMMPYATWSLPLLVLSSALLWFEDDHAFSYSKISPQDFDLHNCASQTVRPRGYDRTVTYQTCDVRLFMNDSMYELNGMTVPYGPVDHLEVRHAVFDHYRMRSVTEIPKAGVKL